MARLSITSTLPLKSGASIPVLGFGVFESPPNITKNSVTAAAKAGYRHFDSAQYYANEAESGSALLSSKIPRGEIFYTTKILNPVNESVDETFQSCKESVERSGLGYIDLFLIHTPQSGPEGRKIMWRALQRCVEEKLVKNIGVSNFGVRHLEELKEVGGVPPCVDQIELHPYCQQRDITEYCEKEGIVVEAYCPLTRGERFKDPVLVKVSEKHGKSPAQVLIRWSLQHGFVPLPKSDTESRIIQNAEVFDFALTDEEMSTIDGLNENKSIFHNPVDAP